MLIDVSVNAFVQYSVYEFCRESLITLNLHFVLVTSSLFKLCRVVPT